jgi:hypothetical protein
MPLKPYLEEPTNCLIQDDSRSPQSNHHLIQDAICPSQDNSDGFPYRPMTRAFQKPIKF